MVQNLKDYKEKISAISLLPAFLWVSLFQSSVLFYKFRG